MNGLNIVAMDGITVEKMYRFEAGAPMAMGPGQRMDVLIKADKSGTYVLQALDSNTAVSVSPMCGQRASTAPVRRVPACWRGTPPAEPCAITPAETLAFAVALATIVVDGSPLPMKLPEGPL